MGLFRRYVEGRIPYLKGAVEGGVQAPLKGSTIGMEVEFLLPISIADRLGIEEDDLIDKGDQVRAVLKKTVPQELPGWKFTEDPSVGVEGEDPKEWVEELEINSPIWAWDFAEDGAEEAYEWLSANRAYMNARCGIHFHISLWTKFSQPPTWFVYNLLSMVDEPGIKDAYPTRFGDPRFRTYTEPMRGRLSKMLRNVRSGFFKLDIGEIGGKLGYHAAISLAKLEKYGTIEIRYFGKKEAGPISLGDLMMPLRYVQNLVTKAASTPAKIGKTKEGGELPEIQSNYEALKNLSPGRRLSFFSKDVLVDGPWSRSMKNPRTPDEVQSLLLLVAAYNHIGYQNIDYSTQGYVGKVLLQGLSALSPDSITDQEREAIFKMIVSPLRESGPLTPGMRQHLLQTIKNPVVAQSLYRGAEARLRIKSHLPEWLVYFLIEHPRYEDIDLSDLLDKYI